MSLLSSITNHAPDKIALQENGYSIRYGDLPRMMFSYSERIKDFECVALMMDNSVEWILWDLAAMLEGVTLVPIPPFFTKDQREHALISSGCQAIITPDGIIPLPYPRVELPAGTAKITYTSGTTGTPKGVCLSREAMDHVARSIVDVLGADMAGIHACVLPLGVLLENIAGVYATLLAGGTVHFTPLAQFGAQYEKLHDALQSIGATSAILVPEILRGLMAQIAALGPLPHLKFIAVGGSKVSPDLLSLAHRMGLPVYEGYGLSECASVVALNTPAHHQRGTTGMILPHITAQIENGELVIDNTGFLGYVGESAPAKIHTGDLAAIDHDGYLAITGRKKNVLITSYGRNVSPEWVESELLAQPEIFQAVVYGDAQPHLSALVVPSRANADVNAAIARANTSLPDYAQVKDFQCIPPLSPLDGTLTGTGRPRRSRVLQLYQKESDHDVLRTA